MPAADLDPVVRSTSLAFGGTAEGVREWLAKAGHEQMRTFRCAKDDAVPAGSLLRIPMGHFFGGRSIGCVGIAGVAVSPEARGAGVASRMMIELVRELHAEKVPLSSLYPATVPLYQRAGYERTGHQFVYHVPLARLTIPRSKLKARAFTPDDLPAVRACYTELARHHDGYLDRGAYVWDRVQNFRGTPYTGLVIEGPAGGIDGYVFFSQERPDNFNGRQAIKVSDIGARTPEAATRAFQLMAEYDSIAEEIIFSGGPAHHFITLIPEHRFQMRFKDYWMLRLTQVEAALAARGYPQIDAQLTLHVTDDQIPENSGPYTLRVKDGRAEVSRSAAGGGGLTMDVRALASLYTGFQTPQHLRQLARLSGDDRSCSVARALFSGGTPSLVDFY